MVWLALALAFLQSPPLPPRDAPRSGTGSGVIRGRITAADTGEPMRRVFVSLAGDALGRRTVAPDGTVSGEVPGPRTVATNADGRYEFAGLPPGTYRVHVMLGSARGGYLGGLFGAASEADPGTPIELADGQRFQADVALRRGGAIVGRVVDEFGDPVTRADVRPSRVRPGGTIQGAGGGFHTDDLGRFRLYGLPPGEYVVSAEARNSGPGSDVASEGFVTTFFPSALTDREAGRIRLGPVAEYGDVEIRLVRTRTFRITGTVIDSRGEPVPRPHVMLTRQTVGGGSSGSGGGFDANGRFVMRDVVPGEYRLVVRTMLPEPDSARPRPGEYASVPVTVVSNIDDLVITTQPGVRVSGQVTFAEGVAPKTLTALRVMAQPADRMMSFGPPAMAPVDDSLQFTLADVFGAQLIRTTGLMLPYTVKAVMLGATDITDVPTEFRPEHRVEIVVTARSSSLEGTVTDDAGAPVGSARVLVLPEDKASWNAASPRFRTAGTSPDGKFAARGLLAGRYLVVAVPRDRLYLGMDPPPEAFAPLMRYATAVVLGEDEKRIVDLRLSRDTQ